MRARWRKKKREEVSGWYNNLSLSFSVEVGENERTRERERSFIFVKEQQQQQQQTRALPWSSDPNVSGPRRSSFKNSNIIVLLLLYIYIYSFSNNSALLWSLLNCRKSFCSFQNNEPRFALTKLSVIKSSQRWCKKACSNCCFTKNEKKKQAEKKKRKKKGKKILKP
jgi:hypothetical protein